LSEGLIPSSKSSQNKMAGLGSADPGQPGSTACAACGQKKRIETSAAQRGFE
jgi:hypothetical protein